MMVKCPKCNYEWKPKFTDNIPKTCPRCNKRLDYNNKPIIIEEGSQSNPQQDNDSEVKES